MGLDQKCRDLEWKSCYAGSACSVGPRGHHWRGVSASVGHIAFVSVNGDLIKILSVSAIKIVKCKFYTFY